MERLEEAEKAGEGGTGRGQGEGDRDPLFRQAAEVCIQNQIGSTSLLQRRMSVGYGRAARDRKSTRLNSSHGYISYAVFCLKKKKQKRSSLILHYKDQQDTDST